MGTTSVKFVGKQTRPETASTEAQQVRLFLLASLEHKRDNPKRWVFPGNGSSIFTNCNGPHSREVPLGSIGHLAGLEVDPAGPVTSKSTIVPPAHFRTVRPSCRVDADIAALALTSYWPGEFVGLGGMAGRPRENRA